MFPRIRITLPPDLISKESFPLMQGLITRWGLRCYPIFNNAPLLSLGTLAAVPGFRLPAQVHGPGTFTSEFLRHCSGLMSLFEERELVEAGR